MSQSQEQLPQNTVSKPIAKMRNGITISVLLVKAIFLLVNKYIFQFTKYELNELNELKDVRESIESDNKNLYSE